MPDTVPFRLKLSGDTAEQHEFQGYDGYMALAGFALTLALVTNYLETGKLRRRGDFLGRSAVRAAPIEEGSILADFSVWLQQNPLQALGLSVSGTVGVNVVSNFVYDVVRRVTDRNLGQDNPVVNPLVQQLLASKSGDVEALVAAAEPSVRQTHSVIGNGANSIQILGGSNVINNYNHNTKEYVSKNVEDHAIIERDFSVAAFNANSGYGSVFDRDIGRTVPISMSREILREFGSVFTWGLDRYANGSGEKVTMRYWRVLAMDGTPKRYVVLSAERASD